MYEDMIKVEFVSLADTDINPGAKKCDIKVFYLGENRNHSYIDKPTAMEMSKSLRGVPIVGWYSAEKKDFRDHGEEMVINGDGITKNIKTNAYGFVPTNAEVWFQDFFETDENGYKVKRTYLMTYGYIWTGQFKEIAEIFNNNSSKGQSMELDGDTLQGSWTNNYDLFIINDATFTKLCMLGDDVEPCFEGASVTPSKYNLSDDFKEEIRTMMKQFSLALEGGKEMDNVEQTVVNDAVETTETSTEFTEVQETPADAATEPTTDPAPESFVKKEDDDEKKEEGKKEEEAPSSDEGGKESSDDGEKKDDEEDKKKKYELLETEFSRLQSEIEGLNAKINALETEKTELLAFKLGVENKQKDELIAKFTTLTDEEKADIIANKEQYTLSDIESKLSILYCRKAMEAAAKEEEEDKEPITTFNLTEVNEPDWIKAVKSHRTQD